jgi:protocatechuate 3,4-dioxygenase beta subunit
MTQTPFANRNRTLVVLLLASFLGMGASLAAPGARAQLESVTAYKLEGVVYGPTYHPLPDATVTVYKMDGKSAGSAKSDAAGKYSIASLGAGKYNLSASDACCKAQWVPIDISGTDPTVQQNFVLLDSSGGGGPLVLKGIVKDTKNQKALANVRIEAYNYANTPNGGGSSQQLTTISGPDGSYSLNVQAGQVGLSARLEGFDVLHADFEIQSARTLDLPMQAATGASVKISGTVKGSDGAPVRNAWINVAPATQGCGRYEACPVASGVAYPSGGGGGAPQGDVSFYYEPANSPYQSVQADDLGHYSLSTVPGKIRVTAYGDKYLENHTDVQANDGDRKTVNLVLERIPDDTVRVFGHVVDASGTPIAFAQLSLENQKWGHWNSTMTKDDGSYEFYTKPGHTLVTASAYREYYVPCQGEAKPMGDSGGAPQSYTPCPSDGRKERAHDYYPQTQTIGGDAQSHELIFKLQARPDPNAELKGYAVNQSSGKGVANVTMNFFNEFTRDWGTATTDQDGSFKIKVHEGYYTIRASAEHFFDGALNTQVKAGESKRIDVQLVPGEKRYGYCCYMMGGAMMGDRAMAASEPSMAPHGKSSGPQPMGAAAASSTVAAGGSAQQMYKGEGGGLGPYQPVSGNPGGGKAPGAPVGLLVAALVGTVLVRRRRDAA